MSNYEDLGEHFPFSGKIADIERRSTKSQNVINKNITNNFITNNSVTGDYNQQQNVVNSQDTNVKQKTEIKPPKEHNLLIKLFKWATKFFTNR